MFLVKHFDLEQEGKSESAGDQGRELTQTPPLAQTSKTRAEVDANHPLKKRKQYNKYKGREPEYFKKSVNELAEEERDDTYMAPTMFQETF